MNIRVIVITGASSSGKDHLCQQIKDMESNMINNVDLHIINTDMFYKDLMSENIVLANEGNYNFDEPNAIDEDALRQVVDIVTDVRSNAYMTPIYNFSQHRHVGFIANDLNTKADRRVIIFQGIFALCFQCIIQKCDFSVFLTTSPDVRLMRRIKRDCVERDRSLSSVLNQYEKFVKIGYDTHVEPLRYMADLCMDYTSTNVKVVETLVLQCLFGSK